LRGGRACFFPRKARDCRVLLTDCRGGPWLVGQFGPFCAAREWLLLPDLVQQPLPERGCIHARREDLHECCMYIAAAHALVVVCVLVLSVCLCLYVSLEGLSVSVHVCWVRLFLFPARVPPVAGSINTFHPEKRAIYTLGMSESMCFYSWQPCGAAGMGTCGGVGWAIAV